MGHPFDIVVDPNAIEHLIPQQGDDDMTANDPDTTAHIVPYIEHRFLFGHIETLFSSNIT